MRERNIELQSDLALRNTRTIILDQGDPEAKREEIRRYFHATYDIDEALLETLRYHETFTRRADPLRHPLIFYFGHTAVLYVNKLLIARLIDRRINPNYESMFAVGVDEMSWDDLNMAHYDWPDVDAVQAYRNTVRDVVDGVISSLPLSLPITWDSPWWAIIMGIEHARIHLETSSVLIRQLPLDQLRPHPLWEICRTSGEPPEPRMIDVAPGRVVIGRSRNHRLYGWDNEFGTHTADVPAFKAEQTLVTNRAYLEFVEDAGYANPKWWTEEGKAWREFQERNDPRFWQRHGGSFRLRQMLEVTDMPWDWPVEVNYLEAKAYCNWAAAKRGKPIRLPTEDEWMLLRDRHLPADQPDWDKAPGNLNLEHFASSCPVTMFPFGEFTDVVGNAWQWTETPISAFRGFEPHPHYDDFSTPTFDTRHNLMKGGSWISTGNEATRDARYAFRRHFFQHAGFRPVESDTAVQVVVDTYETNATLCEYCEFHYGEPCLGVPNYAATMAARAIAAMGERPRRKALDLGCSVGRATFALAREFEHVTGLDFSAQFIRVGVDMKENGYIRYRRKEEGELETFMEHSLAELHLDAVRDRVEFYQADACNMKELYTGYDLILAANLLDRLYNPRLFLERIGERILPGGLLVLSSPYTWMTEFTERNEWIGAFRKDGEPYTTLDALDEILTPTFRRLGDPEDIPFVIRETRRKHQHTIAQCTIWERR